VLLKYVDAVTIPVPDLDEGLAFYRDVLGHEVLWRNDALGQVGLRTPMSSTEIVLVTTGIGYEPDWTVESVDVACDLIARAGGRILSPPSDIPIGRLAVVADPFGNPLVLLDQTTGTYVTDANRHVTGVSQER
jgi:hypothetical protein